MEQKKPSGSLGVSRKDFDLISAELQTTELIRPTETTEYKAQHVEGAEKDRSRWGYIECSLGTYLSSCTL